MAIAAPALASATPAVASGAAGRPDLLHDCHIRETTEVVKCGTLLVLENRARAGGRMIPISFVVIPARRSEAGEGPIFAFGGGPGQTATEDAGKNVGDWRRDDHDWVFVDVRGTGKGNRLDCPTPANSGTAQHYLETVFTRSFARHCRRELERRFDLSQYTTPAAASDVDAVRQALGYAKINIESASFGSYLALIYMRQFPDRVRTAFLGSLVTPANRIPLHFASDAQQSLDSTFSACEADTACNGAFPTARQDFYTLLDNLDAKPASTQIRLEGGRTERVTLSRAGFADAVRVMLYSAEQARSIPFLVEAAKKGNLAPFAEAAIRSNRRLYDSIRFGLFFSVTCNEFVSRIGPAEVAAATEGTFMGDTRVRAQMEACSQWPRSALPGRFFAPTAAGAPTVLAAFSLDNVTGARWAELARPYFSNSVVLGTPGGHAADNECTDEVFRQLLRTASVASLDLGCAASVKLPPFQLSPKAQPR